MLSRIRAILFGRATVAVTPMLLTPPAAIRATDDDGNLIWPDDPDEVPAWRLALEAKAEAWGWAEQGVKLPPYRTRRESDRCKAEDDARELARAAMPGNIDKSNIARHVPALTVAPVAQVGHQPYQDIPFFAAAGVTRPADMAARQFLAAIRDRELVVEFSAGELSTAYIDWCRKTGQKAFAIDTFKAALGRLDGVYKDQPSQYVRGRRHRPTRWIISPADMQAEPMRIAA